MVAPPLSGTAPSAPHVFELYRQADESGSNRPGLGIGLSIVAQIVKLHGGTVRVESPGLGQGSSFVVTLPLLLQTPAAGTDSSSGSSGRRSGRSRRAKPAHATTTNTEKQS